MTLKTNRCRFIKTTRNKDSMDPRIRGDDPLLFKNLLPWEQIFKPYLRVTFAPALNYFEYRTSAKVTLK